MRWSIAFVATACLLLAACGPKIEGEILLTRGVTVRNADSSSFTINKIVANNNDDDPSCIDTPGRTLMPGDSYSTTFVICGSINSVRVETDKGSTTLTKTASGN